MTLVTKALPQALCNQSRSFDVGSGTVRGCSYPDDVCCCGSFFHTGSLRVPRPPFQQLSSYYLFPSLSLESKPLMPHEQEAGKPQRDGGGQQAQSVVKWKGELVVSNATVLGEGEEKEVLVLEQVGMC